MAATELSLLCAGAAQGLVEALRPQLGAALGIELVGRFGAVGAMREALFSGVPCDLFIVTDAMQRELEAQGPMRPATRTPLGRVRTGVAVPTGVQPPSIDTPEALAVALQAAEDGWYVPDTVRATAGIHFAKVVAELGLDALSSVRLKPYPNGATAMRSLAADARPHAIGCTQVSEILATPGVRLVGALPPRFELATVYSAAVPVGAAHPDLAQLVIAALSSAENQALRGACGIED